MAKKKSGLRGGGRRGNLAGSRDGGGGRGGVGRGEGSRRWANVMPEDGQNETGWARGNNIKGNMRKKKEREAGAEVPKKRLTSRHIQR